MSFASELISMMTSEIIRQEDPKNRVITAINIIPKEECSNLKSYIITSECDGFAEDTKVLFQSCREFEPSDFIGKTEFDASKIYGSDIDEIIAAYNEIVKQRGFSDGEDGWQYIDTNTELGSYLELMCCGTFITSGGRCNWETINKIREFGYAVFAGDKDSFGWLTGCLQKDNGPILVYG